MLQQSDRIVIRKDRHGTYITKNPKQEKGKRIIQKAVRDIPNNSYKADIETNQSSLERMLSPYEIPSKFIRKMKGTEYIL